MKEAGRIIFTLPYERGWKVTVNGKEVEGALFGGSLMAFDLEPGKYHFDMKYVPEGAVGGIVVSVISILTFIAVMVLQRFERKLEDTLIV